MAFHPISVGSPGTKEDALLGMSMHWLFRSVYSREYVFLKEGQEIVHHSLPQCHMEIIQASCHVYRVLIDK